MFCKLHELIQKVEESKDPCINMGLVFGEGFAKTLTLVNGRYHHPEASVNDIKAQKTL